MFEKGYFISVCIIERYVYGITVRQPFVTHFKNAAYQDSLCLQNLVVAKWPRHVPLGLQELLNVGVGNYRNCIRYRRYIFIIIV